MMGNCSKTTPTLHQASAMTEENAYDRNVKSVPNWSPLPVRGLLKWQLWPCMACNSSKAEDGYGEVGGKKEGKGKGKRKEQDKITLIISRKVSTFSRHLPECSPRP